MNGVRAVLSLIGNEINIGGEGQIQSDNELPRAFFNLLGTLGSALQKKASPKDEVAPTFLSLFNMLISGDKNMIRGGAQKAVHVDTFPTYTGKHFDQSILMDSVDENAAAMVEGDVDHLSEEAKTQLWGAILGTP